MSEDWSPDEPLDTEAFEAWDEALDSEDEEAPGSVGAAEGERELDRELFADQAEEEEAGTALDDPERMAELSGGIDDPDGVDVPAAARPRRGEEGWDLDAAERATEGRIGDTE